MSAGVETWEGVAAAIHEGTGLDDPPVSAFELARMCGLRLRPWGSGTGALVGEEIYFPRKARLVRQHGVVAHELGHWALGWAGEEDSEEGARWLAGALHRPQLLTRLQPGGGHAQNLGQPDEGLAAREQSALLVAPDRLPSDTHLVPQVGLAEPEGGPALPDAPTDVFVRHVYTFAGTKSLGNGRKGTAGA